MIETDQQSIEASSTKQTPDLKESVMISKRKLLAATFGGIILAGAVSANANAGGWIADNIIKPIAGEHAARAADQWNAQNGNVVDHTIAAGANAVVPGSGTALEAGWAVQRSGILDDFGRPIGAPVQAPQQPMQNVAMGNRCVTFRGWVYGPYNPVGSFCHVDGSWGSDPGTVMQ